MTIKGSRRFGNREKNYTFYSNAWAYYDNGKAYTLDIDDVLIDTIGRPYRITSFGIEIDTAKVNEDFKNKNDRRIRNLKKPYID